MSPLWAALDPLTAAERSQGMLKEDLATGVIVGLAAACVVLTTLLVRSYTSSASVVLAMLERSTTRMEQNTASLEEVAGLIRERLPVRRAKGIETKTNPGAGT